MGISGAWGRGRGCWAEREASSSQGPAAAAFADSRKAQYNLITTFQWKNIVQRPSIRGEIASHNKSSLFSTHFSILLKLSKANKSQVAAATFIYYWAPSNKWILLFWEHLKGTLLILLLFWEHLKRDPSDTNQDWYANLELTNASNEAGGCEAFCSKSLFKVWRATALKLSGCNYGFSVSRRTCGRLSGARRECDTVPPSLSSSPY